MPHRTHFDFLAPFYDRVIRPADVSHLSRLAGLPCAGRLLDAGGGTGRIADSLAERLGARVHIHRLDHSVWIVAEG